ncbi:heme lyase CcmF/NrfE family subunit [Roseateles sp. LKC17W]|uniref:Heme lyase CcmF/NrfE family subunit n=1 Tax=Pelomonas margarita TaxID=3299031 RepID=A0ABW7FN51_9BURK
MIVELGHLALWLALAVAVLLAVLPLRAAARDDLRGMRLAAPLTVWLGVFVLAGYAALSWAFASADFSVAYVARHANRELPLAYRLAAVWGGHEGSLLLWAALLSGWMLALRAASGDWPDALRARVLGVMGGLAAGFLLFLLAASNPFERVLPALPDGNDLNPLLQDPGMVLHPPMLYMGYVGFTVAFAFAVAALLGSEITPAWARRARAWTLAAWSSLTLGIALGSWWAYSELGWGGWWFWDPVENASFMPWLAGTALLHSLAVTEKRGAFKAWTVLLSVLCFGLALLGTFLVRSGVLSSVHAFATDPRRGLFILAFLVVVVGGSLALYATRAGRLGLGARFHWRSRETALLANNAMLVAACGAVLLGTLYPLLLDALTGQKLSVGPPYFEAVFVPLMAPVVLLMGLGPLLRWKQADTAELLKRLRLPLLLAPLAAGVQAWASGLTSLPGVLGLLLAWWVLATVAADVGARWRTGMPRSVAAMQLAHAGVGVFIVGVTLVGSLQVEQDVQLAPGDVAEVGGYRVQMQSLRTVEGPNYRAAQAQLAFSRDGHTVAVLRPEKRVYNSSEMPMTEAGIDSGWWRDLYASLAEPLDTPRGRAWIVRVSIKPCVNWIWGGCVLMALGGLLAASDRRYRGAPA